MDDRFFKIQIDSEGESRRESQQKLIDLEFEGVDAAQYPGISAEGLFLERLFVKPHPEVVSCGELFEIVADAFGRADGMGRKGRDEHGMFMIKPFDLVDFSGAYAGYPF